MALDCLKPDEFDADPGLNKTDILDLMTGKKEVEIRVAPIDPWYLENVVCPVDHTELRVDGRYLISKRGRRYPVVEGLPVLFA
jgi:hypothetical protein